MNLRHWNQCLTSNMVVINLFFSSRAKKFNLDTKKSNLQKKKFVTHFINEKAGLEEWMAYLQLHSQVLLFRGLWIFILSCYLHTVAFRPSTILGQNTLHLVLANIKWSGERLGFLWSRHSQHVTSCSWAVSKPSPGAPAVPSVRWPETFPLLVPKMQCVKE